MDFIIGLFLSFAGLFGAVAGFFVVGSTIFYLGLFVLLCWMVLITEREWDGSAILSTAILFLLVWLGYGMSPLQFASHSPWLAVAAVIGYFAIGFGWLLIRWIFHALWVRDLGDPVRDFIATTNYVYIGDIAPRMALPGDYIPTNQRDEPNRMIRSFDPEKDDREKLGNRAMEVWLNLKLDFSVGLYRGEFPPNFKKHKKRLVYWGIYWPFSAFWTLLRKPIKYLYNYLINIVGGHMQAITNRIVKIN